MTTTAAAWNPHLHPRDRSGRFIEIGSILSWFFGPDEHRGTVLRINPDTGLLSVRETDGKLSSVRPGDARVQVHAPRAHLPEVDADLPGLDDNVDAYLPALEPAADGPSYDTEIKHDTKLWELLEVQTQAWMSFDQKGDHLLSKASTSYGRPEKVEEGALYYQPKTFERGEEGYYFKGGRFGRTRAYPEDVIKKGLLPDDDKTVVAYLKAKSDLADAIEAVNEHEKAYGGWNRYFLVTSSSGHVHRSMSCSTCNPRTMFRPVIALSGHTDNEAIDALGETLCTVCFPDAPIGKPSKITKGQATKMLESMAPKKPVPETWEVLAPKKPRQRKEVVATLNADQYALLNEIRREGQVTDWSAKNYTAKREAQEKGETPPVDKFSHGRMWDLVKNNLVTETEDEIVDPDWVYRPGGDYGMYGILTEDEAIEKGINKTRVRIYTAVPWDENDPRQVGTRVDDGEETTAFLPALTPDVPAPSVDEAVDLPEGVVPDDPEAPRQIKAVHLGELEDRVAKLNKRAEKIGVEPMTLEIGEREIKTESVITGYDLVDEPIWEQVQTEYVTVAVKGQTPKLPGGWTFLGTVEHNYHGHEANLIHGDDERLSAYRTSEAQCDWCHQTRDRKHTVILEDENGKMAQVGKSCVKDFLGWHARPDAWLAWVDDVDDVYGFERDEDYVPSRPTAGTDQAMAVIAAVVRRYGFTPKSSQQTPTSAVVERVLNPKPWRKYDEGTPLKEMVDGLGPITDEDRATADDVLTWARDIDPVTATNYLGNMNIVLSQTHLDLYKDLGIAASAITARERNRAEEAPPGEHYQLDEYQEKYSGRRLTDEDLASDPKLVETARYAVDLLGGDVKNDFVTDMYNQVTSGKALSPRQARAALNALGSQISSHVRGVQRLNARLAGEELPPEPSPEWGEVGKRGVVVAKVVSKKAIESDYGLNFLVKMETPEGQTLVTFNSGAFGDEAEVGKVFLGKATVKKYGEWQGQVETQLSRVAASDWDVPFETPAAPAPKAKRTKKVAAPKVEEAPTTPGWIDSNPDLVRIMERNKDVPQIGSLLADLRYMEGPDYSGVPAGENVTVQERINQIPAYLFSANRIDEASVARRRLEQAGGGDTVAQLPGLEPADSGEPTIKSASVHYGLPTVWLEPPWRTTTPYGDPVEVWKFYQNGGMITAEGLRVKKDGSTYARGQVLDVHAPANVQQALIDLQSGSEDTTAQLPALSPNIPETWDALAGGDRGETTESYSTGEPTVKVNGHDPEFIFRVVSGPEWDAAVADGFMKARDNTLTFGALYPDLTYLDGPTPDQRIVKIRYDPADEWGASWTGDQLDVATRKPIPLDRVVAVTPGANAREIVSHLPSDEVTAPPAL